MLAECHYSYELEHFFVFIHRNKDIAGGLEGEVKAERLLRNEEVRRNRSVASHLA